MPAKFVATLDTVICGVAYKAGDVVDVPQSKAANLIRIGHIQSVKEEKVEKPEKTEQAPSKKADK